MSHNQKIQEKVKKLKKTIEGQSMVSNWVEYVKWSEMHPDELPNMTPRFRKWMDEIGAGI